MTREDILRMAREAGFDVDKKDGAYEAFEDNGYYIQTDRVIKFAALVAAAEREACAALLEANGMRCGKESLSRLILETNAAAIRARSKE